MSTLDKQKSAHMMNLGRFAALAFCRADILFQVSKDLRVKFCTGPAQAFFGKSGSDNFVRLEGRVSTANNGGFIQIRHSLEKYLDNDIKGISIKVRGNGEEYYVFIRTTSTLLPWQFYNASFKTSKNWKVVKINLQAFQPSSNFLRKTIKSSSIKSIGIVAYGRDHDAKVDISEIYFFK